jgi:hypothetical protein
MASAREEGWPLHVGAFFVGGAGSAHPSTDVRLTIGDRFDQVKNLPAFANRRRHPYVRETVFPFRRVNIFEPPPVAMNQLQKKYPGTLFVYNNMARCALPGEEIAEGRARDRRGTRPSTPRGGLTTRRSRR